MWFNPIQGLNVAQASSRLTAKHIATVSNRETLTKEWILSSQKCSWKSAYVMNFYNLEGIHSFILMEN